MPEEKPDDVEKVLLDQKAIEDLKQGLIDDLVLRKPDAIKAFDEKRGRLGCQPEGAPARRSKAWAFATGMKIA
jgi:hypothetical protein